MKFIVKGLLVVKFTILILTLFFIQLSASVRGQITLNMKNAPAKEVLDAIGDQTGYSFLYDEASLSLPVLSVRVKDASLEETLDVCFKGLPVAYKVISKNVLLRAKTIPVKLAIPQVISRPQAFTVTGTVTDSLGTVAGVSIALKGKPSVGTTTDQNGKYILDVPDGNGVLVFSMVGYQTKEVPIGGKNVLNIQIELDHSGLDEVVVVGYGTQKKESVIGSITTIKPSELKTPSSNLTTALAGRLAGVIAYQRSGEPGADNATFFIRGATTFGYKQDPLILIDGMEYTTTDLARLQPDDIQEFSILKDATASAVYGARGANGVILVTTKGGKEETAKINVRAEQSLSAPTKDVELADPITYMNLSNEAVLTRNPLGNILYQQNQIDNTIAGTNPIAFPVVDWQDQLFKDYVANQRYNINMSGGGKAATYYVAGTYNRDNGILNVDKRNNFNSNIDLKSFNLRANVNINVSKSTKVGVRLNGNFDDYNGPINTGSEIYQMVMRAPQTKFLPYYPELPEDRGINHIKFGNTIDQDAVNPYAEMVKGYKEYSRSLMVAQVELNQDLDILTPGLKLNGMMNVNRRAYSDLSRQYVPYWYALTYYDKLTDTYSLIPLNDGDPSEGGGTDWMDYHPGTKTVNSVFHFQTALNYNRTFKEKHEVSAMGILVMQSETQSNAETLQESLPYRNFGVSGRTTYNYDSRYFFEFNFGYNGSERFAASHRYGFFPSGGIAWAVSNEKFFKPLTGVVNKLRLRANLGLVGNDAIGSADERFFYLSEVNMEESGYGASFGTTGGTRRNGYSINRYANPDISWETSRNTTLGMELGLWNKLNIVAEYFMDHRYNILMSRASIPATMGLQAIPKANVGEVKSHSTELQMDYNDHIGPDFHFAVRGNFTFAQNHYEAFEEPQYDESWLYRKGYSTSQTWGYIAERLFVDDEEVRSSPTQNFNQFITRGGDIKYKDINGDGVINSLDMVPIGFPRTPEIVYGFGFSSSYKAFDFSAFFQGAARSSFWIDVAATSPFVGYRQLLKAYADSYWSEDNRNLYALWPRLSNTVNGNSNVTSTWFMRDGAFLRLKSVELGYTLPERWSNRVKLDRLRIYGSATNLFSVSRFKTWDVEMAGDGLGYPVQRVINFGVQLDF